jgi:DNA-binding response OmpR family regulator
MVLMTQILVADDDAQITGSLADQLSSEGYSVTVASTGSEALSLLLRIRYDLVVLDLKMPYIDGFEVLKALKGHSPSTKVIVLTGYADEGNVLKCRNMGADEVLRKPYDPEELFSAVHQVLQSRSHSKQ